MSELFQTGLAGEQFLPGDARAALIIVHGLGEHRGRYRAVAERLKALGIACFTYDLSGHGESPGSRTHIEKFSDFTDDLRGVVKAVGDHYPTLPIFLWGHSLGSIVVLAHVLQHPDGIQGGITTGCPLAAVPKGVSAVSNVGSKFCDVLPEIRVSSRLDPVLLSHDGSVQTAYRNDPLVTTTVTLKLVFELSQAIKRLKKRIHEIRTPFLAVHGSEDEIAPPEGSKLLVDALGSKDKRLVIIEASRHEVQNEKAEQREQFLEWISEWIKERAKQRSENVISNDG